MSPIGLVVLSFREEAGEGKGGGGGHYAEMKGEGGEKLTLTEA